ncbi:hypothetical protein C8P63_101238 [Melghirimyces profundicolus]|uniref:YkoP-like domain-containing protein n=1 Tax=Melghirimyces profundicolus TaxID=1242148 RepID=A0A2T6C9R1_9BACL|nr:hypothetical protein [Melghirimyces profundicolus]PTX65016.1 hypothetical protein C8P63_101238 [Melghirimyces profundicolus]
MATGTFLAAWRWVDKFYCRAIRLQNVDRSDENLFRIVVKPYRGEPLVTRDGIVLKKGDWYAKLHLHNFRIAQLLAANAKNNQGGNGIWNELIVLRRIVRSFPALARYLENHARGSEIRILLGTTFLHRGSERLGFDVRDLPSAWQMRLKSFLLQFILFCCQPEGWKRLLNQQNQMIPKRVFISKEQFHHRYQQAGSK